MIKVLVVDDEPQILRALRINLRARGYDVEVAACGTEALRVAATQQPELVVLDLGLPDLDGLDVIHGLRGWTAVPIIVLSGRSGSSDKVAALDAGADDYVTKPFGVDELLARMRAFTRRAAGQAPAGATVTDLGDRYANEHQQDCGFDVGRRGRDALRPEFTPSSAPGGAIGTLAYRSSGPSLLLVVLQ
jgi:two-component system, OmpR family, KDP operon response regulator KdpE